MGEASHLLFTLIRSAFCGKNLSEDERALYSEDTTREIIALSKRHDISHIVSYALSQNGILPDGGNDLSRHVMTAIYRYEQLNYEFDRLCRALEKAEVPFIPLKGSVIRKYYKEPWMRTSCDIDILVHEDQVDSTAEYLVKECGYTNKGKSSHDISLFTPGKNHIELHYDLLEDGLINESSEVLSSVWDTAAVREGYKYWLEMPDEMFYFYHIAHMAKHFVNGGCGIRPFIDLWILDGIEDRRLEERDELLKRGGLLKFAEITRHLSRVWLDGEEHTEITRQTEQYILFGGVYGIDKNRIAVQQQKRGGRFKYALSKIFLPYEAIKFHYPILLKHRWLTPFMEVRRWFKLVFCGHAKRSVNELRYNSSISKTEAENMQTFLENIGL